MEKCYDLGTDLPNMYAYKSTDILTPLLTKSLTHSTIHTVTHTHTHTHLCIILPTFAHKDTHIHTHNWKQKQHLYPIHAKKQSL